MPNDTEPDDKKLDIEAEDAESQEGDGGTEKASAAAYEVGYKKPPKSSRFKPGESGNKRGRPKGNKNFKTDLLEELQEKITIREGGKEKKVTRQRAYVKKVYNDAMSKNARGSNLLLSAIARFVDPEVQELEARDKLSNDNQAILDDFTRRLRRQIKAEQVSTAATEDDPSEETE